MCDNYPKIYKNSLVHYGLIEKEEKILDSSGNYYSQFLYDQEKKSS